MRAQSSDDLIYLDFAATTPVDEGVLNAMLPFFARDFGNASSQHRLGRFAAEAVERARAQVAALVNCESAHVVWTSGATESNNLAIKGAVLARGARANHAVSQKSEHRAVLDPLEALRLEGTQVTLLDPEPCGVVLPAAVERTLKGEIALVSIMMANNEVGSISPVAEIAAICERFGVPFHTDASQAVGKIPIDIKASHIDLLSLSGHKIYGPKGIGALIFRASPKLRRLHPVIDGGGHERGIRSGTLNVPAIVGLGVACEIAREQMREEHSQTACLRDAFEAMLLQRLPGVVVNGLRSPRLPNISNIAFLGIDAESLLLAMDRIAASTGSACTSHSIEPSHVLAAIGLPEDQQRASVRFSLGRRTTPEEITEAVTEIVEKVSTLRSLAPTFGDLDALPCD